MLKECDFLEGADPLFTPFPEGGELWWALIRPHDDQGRGFRAREVPRAAGPDPPRRRTHAPRPRVLNGACEK